MQQPYPTIFADKVPSRRHSDMVRIDLRATLGVEMVQWETATIP